MSIVTQLRRRTTLGAVGSWWKKWRKRPSALGELRSFGTFEMERVARDAGIGVGDLRILAGKWPDSADLVTRRMAAMGLDAGETERGAPDVVRDLQRVCSLCGNKRVCEHDLDRGPAKSHWQDYCPNAGRIQAICAQSSGNSGRKGS
jgi:Family of unknown function (DUF6455)